MTSVFDNIDQLLQQGEGERVEFKRDVRGPRQLARDLAAFANASGGLLVIGGDDTEVAPRGVDPERTARIVQQAASLIEPAVHITGHEVKAGGATLYVVEVPEQQGKPFVVDERIYIRRGAGTFAATAEELKTDVIQRDESRELLLAQLDSFADALARQGMVIERLEQSSTWQRQLLWTLLGAVLGTVLGVIATILMS